MLLYFKSSLKEPGDDILPGGGGGGTHLMLRAWGQIR